MRPAPYARSGGETGRGARPRVDVKNRPVDAASDRSTTSARLCGACRGVRRSAFATAAATEIEHSRLADQPDGDTAG